VSRREVRLSTATVTSKGQITIPKEVRETLGLAAGHRVSFQIRADKVVEMRPENVDLMSLFGIFKPRVKGVTLEDMEEAIGEGAERDLPGAEPPGVRPTSGFL
jgi:AbrB family looped-hinge helix DNA binding protein